MNERYQEVCIGIGEIGHTAKKTKHENVSENETAYWIYNCLDLRLKMYIIKGTLAANDLKKLLDANKPCQSYLDKLYLEFVDPEIIKDAITARCEEAVETFKQNVYANFDNLLKYNKF